MSKRVKLVSLAAFLKGTSKPKDKMPGCSNYDSRYGGCLFADECSVEAGQRCEYFEKNVLPIASENGLYEVLAEYQDATGSGDETNLIAAKGRHCPECGKSLQPRRRLCDDCALKCRRKTQREYHRRYRAKNKTCA